jgi:hypothetical protein
MRAWETKIDNTAPASSGILTAAEDDSRGAEFNNLATSAGLTLDVYNVGTDTDLTMAAQAVARYASGGIEFTDSGSANAYVLSGTGAFVVPKAYFLGQIIMFAPGNANTGASTVNANSVGVKALMNYAGSALVGGELIANVMVAARYSPTANSGAGAFLLLPWSDTAAKFAIGYYATSQNITVPGWSTQMLVKIWGGGGAGGSTSSVEGAIGQGGGGAEYREGTWTVVPGSTLYLTVGAGGTPAAAGGAYTGGAGGYSVVATGAGNIFAAFGGGGGPGSATGPATPISNGGYGGGGGSLDFPGQPGETGGAIGSGNISLGGGGSYGSGHSHFEGINGFVLGNGTSGGFPGQGGGGGLNGGAGGPGYGGLIIIEFH